jgi:hypothetical protein
MTAAEQQRKKLYDPKTGLYWPTVEDLEESRKRLGPLINEMLDRDYAKYLEDKKRTS